MSMVAIITARGGSKRIPRKNIRDFMGKPMIAYAIDAALRAEIFDEVMVSTDDDEIAQIAKKYGAVIPFMRSVEAANDFATTTDVLNEVFDNYKKNDKKFDEFCCIYPCVPFLTSEILKNAYETFKNNANLDCLIPVVKFSFPIQRAFRVNDKQMLEFREPKHALTRSQDLEPMYHDVGMFYFAKTDSFLTKHSLITPNTGYIEMDEALIQDIDNESDWKMAEIKYKVLKNV